MLSKSESATIRHPICEVYLYPYFSTRVCIASLPPQDSKPPAQSVISVFRIVFVKSADLFVDLIQCCAPIPKIDDGGTIPRTISLSRRIFAV